MNIQTTPEENVIADGAEYIAREAFGTAGCADCHIDGFCSKDSNPPCLPWERKDQRGVTAIRQDQPELFDPQGCYFDQAGAADRVGLGVPA